MARLTLADKATRLFDQAFRVRLAMKGRATVKRPSRRIIIAAVVVLLLGLPREMAWAAEGLDLTLPASRLPDQQTLAAIDSPVVETSGFARALAAWEAWVARARATQPYWSTPLVTTTGLLEQRVRFDVDFQHSGNGTSTTDIDGGRGLDLIVSETNEIQFAAPPYYIRTGVAGTGPTNKGAIQPLAGFNDWAFLRVKQRLASSPESDGNYVLTALLQIQAPSGIGRLTSNSWEYLPTLAFGKGWGAFDIQGTVGGVVPASHANIIGYQIQTNFAFQYNVLKVLWPELEVSWTYFANGQRGGLNQVYLTPGLLLGRFSLSNGLKLTFGVGYQAAVAPALIVKPLTPAFNHAWLFSTRVNF
jgi:hypothetical protein